MKLFMRYLLIHTRNVIVYLIFCAVFAVTFALYRLPVSAVGYACAISAFIGAAAVLLDYIAFYRKHRQLEFLMHEITVTADHLPAPKGLLEEDYQALVRIVYDERQKLEDRMNAKYTDLVEYYTVWAHQIKTPIASMRLNLQSEETPLNKELSYDLLRIEQYVEMVLGYLRLDAGTTDYLIRRCDLDSIIKQAVRRFSSQFIRKKLRLEYEPVNCSVLTDEKWLLFVIEQVLSNAIKYTKSGSISITLEEPKTLCIRDTGIGIAMEDIPRVFEKGYTGYNGRSDKKASGIGLYLCRRICENLGHKIQASSAVGAGTSIRICLDSADLETE